MGSDGFLEEVGRVFFPAVAMSGSGIDREWATSQYVDDDLEGTADVHMGRYGRAFAAMKN